MTDRRPLRDDPAWTTDLPDDVHALLTAIAARGKRFSMQAAWVLDAHTRPAGNVTKADLETVADIPEPGWQPFTGPTAWVWGHTGNVTTVTKADLEWLLDEFGKYHAGYMSEFGEVDGDRMADLRAGNIVAAAAAALGIEWGNL